MADSLESESAAALLSMKDGGLSQSSSSSQPIGQRNPPRIRKRNRRIFNDDEDTSYTLSRSSPRKSSRLASPVSTNLDKRTDDPEWMPERRLSTRAIKKETVTPVTIPDKRVIQKVGIRMRNLLKLPKAHRWVCYEWFYSNIDRALFLVDNEFCAYLKESFPFLKTRQLTRVEWCKIRRIMGKPRRCSSAFFEEERASLHSKRNKIRQLQQRKAVDIAQFQDLPEEIPLPLVIGTKVTARLRKPQDGLFMGSIDAVDTANATYRITFDRPGLGSHSIPDYEVLSNDTPETMPITSFAQKHRPRSLFYSPPRYVPCASSPQLENDPLLAGSPLRHNIPSIEDSSTLGGFPIKFLILLVRLRKILQVKNEKISMLKEMNTQAEKMRSHQEPITIEFQKRYAALIMEFEKLNKDLEDHLLGVQQFCQEIAPEQGLQPTVQPDVVRHQCLEEAREVVHRYNTFNGYPLVTEENILELLADLTSVMLQIKCLAETDLNSFEFKSLNEALSEIQNNLEPQNISVFQNQVQIHINHIQNGLCQMGNLHAFASQNIPV